MPFCLFMVKRSMKAHERIQKPPPCQTPPLITELTASLVCSALWGQTQQKLENNLAPLSLVQLVSALSCQQMNLSNQSSGSGPELAAGLGLVGDDEDAAGAGASSCSGESEARPHSPTALCYSYTLQLDSDMESMLQPCHPASPHPQSPHPHTHWSRGSSFTSVFYSLFSFSNPNSSQVFCAFSSLLAPAFTPRSKFPASHKTLTIL